MGRKRTSRAKKKRTKRMKGGMQTKGPATVIGGTGPGGRNTLDVRSLSYYLSQINSLVAHLKGENYEEDKLTANKVSKELFDWLEEAIPITPGSAK